MTRFPRLLFANALEPLSGITLGTDHFQREHRHVLMPKLRRAVRTNGEQASIVSSAERQVVAMAQLHVGDDIEVVSQERKWEFASTLPRPFRTVPLGQGNRLMFHRSARTPAISTNRSSIE